MAGLRLLALALATLASAQVFNKGHHAHKGHIGGGAGHHKMQGVHTSTKNVGVSEKVLDGHVDDLVWASKDGNTMFLVSGRVMCGN